MNERDKLIKKLIEEKGGSHKDYLHLLNTIAHHESAGTYDPSLKQIGGGPGRGKYQFENGKNGGGITAAKRTKNYYKEKNIPVPEWLDRASSKDNLDASNLTSEQQDILFLANMRKHPKADLSKVISGKEDISDFWAKYHWAGPSRNRKEKIKQFNESLTTKEKNIITPSNNIPNPPPVVSDFRSENNFYDYVNKKMYGGDISSNFIKDKNLNEFNEGGLHEENPYGGIPQGTGINGKMNTVEEGETSFELKRGKYIFSNRLTL